MGPKAISQRRSLYLAPHFQATCKKTADQVALKVYHMENLCELNHYQVWSECEASVRKMFPFEKTSLPCWELGLSSLISIWS